MSLKSYIFPEVCSLCKENKSFDESYICKSCLNELERTPENSCQLCSSPIDTFLKLCHQCIENPRPWQKGKAPLLLKGQSREIIHKFKYNSQIILSRYLVQAMVEKIHQTTIRELSCVTPVPMHWFKKMKRGFNQAELLAEGISKALDKPHLPLLKRKMQKSVQALKSRSQRKENISHIFEINEKQKVPEGTILLVDDVLTTGATLTACSKVLLENGAREIYVLTAARG
ncbi:MAG: ComF family protein [Lentisphaerales bacterium]|nr:ComF family protein [Lentisphaerales bacterium]